MWLLALRSETTHDSESAALLWDLKQYFEHIDREVLRQEAEETQFPQYVLEMAVTAYQAQRVITMRGLACRVGHSKVGGTAGCPIIATLIQVYTMRALAVWVSRNPSVGLMVYVDDFTLKGEGESTTDLCTTMEPAIVDMKCTQEQQLRARVSPEKADLICSPEATRCRLEKFLGRLAGPRRKQKVVRGLGLCFALGRRRREFWGRGVSKGRLNTMKARVARIFRLRKAKQSIFTTNALPALTYGCTLYGVDNREDYQLRQASAKLTGGGRGKRMDVHTACLDDTSWRATCGPILAWSNAVWELNTPGGAAAAAPADLRSAGERVEQEQPSRWGDVRGPASAMLLSMKRLRWTWPSPFQWRDEEGQQHSFTTSLPAMVAQAVRSAYRAAAVRRLEGLLGIPAGKKLDMEPVYAAVHSKQLDELEK